MSAPAQPRTGSRDGQSPKTEVTGVLEILQGGNGFLRSAAHDYQPHPDDIFVSQGNIRRFGLRPGDEVEGTTGQPQGRGRNVPLESVTSLNGLSPDEIRGRPDFNSLPASYPDERLQLEFPAENSGMGITNRIVDLISPLGKGQRALIVAPARAGKTMLLQSVIAGIAHNYPDAKLFILLVDERPEEVTEMEMLGLGEVVASSFDCPADRHVGVAEMVLERARRQVECGRDVVIVLDSLTRLARSYNQTERGTGKLLSGGIDSGALEKPKRFFGSARRVSPKAGGGSLTIVATALIDTGSRGDEVIFEEFKGTGNSEIVLDREIAERRIFPAIDINKSATRKEELLFKEDQIVKIHQLRRALHSLSTHDAISLLRKQIADTESNDELLARLR
jgi:transcription termination factor Rho